MSEIVAVYGSLKRGFYNNSVFPEGSEFITEAYSKPEYTLINMGSFPGVVHEGDTEIFVELHKVPDLRQLDRLEGNGSFYTRVKADFIAGKTTYKDVWIYLLPASYIREDNQIEEGVWR